MIQRRQNPERRDGHDRRERPRRAARGTLRFLRGGTDANEILAGELLDVSPTGVRLLLAERLRPAERLIIELRDGDQTCLNLPAEVIWADPEPGDRHLVGCELRLEMTRKQQQMLKQFLHAEV